MTVEQVLIVAFGLPTIGLLTGIFFRMGKLEAANESLSKTIAAFEKDIADLWRAVNRIRENKK